MTEQVKDTVAWCCRHRWTLSYLTVVATAGLILQILELRGVL